MLSTGDTEIQNIDSETKEPPKTRIKNAKSVRMLYTDMVQADGPSRRKRSAVQSMLDGRPPYTPQALEASGQGGITNIDWGEGEAIHDAGVTAMLDVVQSVEDLAVIPLKTNTVPDPELQRSYEQILASEASRTIREWDGFDFAYQALITYWFDHGTGINYFEDCYNWKWEVSGLGDFVLPRDTRASESMIPYCACVRAYQLHEIWEKIQDPESAEAAGWNINAVKVAMLKCSTKQGSPLGTWDELERGLRDNDYCASGKAEKVRIVHFWAKQFDGTVSTYLVTEDELTGHGLNDEPFLYKSDGMYASMREAFTFFFYGIGTNRNIHGIVGQMHKIYPQIQYANRLRCSYMDAAKMGASVMLKPSSEADLGNLALVTYSNYTVLPSNLDVVPHASPNLEMNLGPAISMMQQMMDKRTGQVDLQAPYANQQEKTALEVRTTLGQQARVGQSQLSLFIPPWGRHLREVIRRLCRPDYDESLPGGMESKAMRRRLQEQGFPLELLQAIDFDAVTCTQAIAAGSPAVRAAALAELEPMMAGYDAVGQHNFKRDKTAGALRSYRAADRYIPKMPGDVRPPMDKQIALLENSVMEMGKTAEVVVNQMHTVHLDTHLPHLLNFVEIAEQNIDEGVQFAQQMAIEHDHCVQHLENIQMDTTIQEKTALYRQALQQAGEVIGNTQRRAEKLNREAEEAQAEEGQQQQSGLTPEQESKLQENNLKLMIMREQADTKAAIRLQEFYQKKALRDADAAAKMVLAAKVSRARQNQQ